MPDNNDPENRLIRLLLLSTACVLLSAVLAMGIVLVVMISTNFNILSWME